MEVQLLLKVRDGNGERGLRDMQLLGRRVEVEQPREHTEVTELKQCHSALPPSFANGPHKLAAATDATSKSDCRFFLILTLKTIMKKRRGGVDFIY